MDCRLGQEALRKYSRPDLPADVDARLEQTDRIGHARAKHETLFLRKTDSLCVFFEEYTAVGLFQKGGGNGRRQNYWHTSWSYLSEPTSNRSRKKTQTLGRQDMWVANRGHRTIFSIKKYVAIYIAYSYFEKCNFEMSFGESIAANTQVMSDDGISVGSTCPIPIPKSFRAANTQVVSDDRMPVGSRGPTHVPMSSRPGNTQWSRMRRCRRDVQKQSLVCKRC